jgi:hypothetical protein
MPTNVPPPARTAGRKDPPAEPSDETTEGGW